MNNINTEDNIPIFKKVLKLILKEFIYGGHFLSLGAVSIVFTSAILLGIKITWDCLVAVYLIAQSPYLFNRYKEFNKDFLTNPERTRHIGKYVQSIPLMIFCFIIILIGLVIHFSNISTLLFTFLLLSIGFLYSIFFKKITKKIIGFKNIYLALAWALLVIFLAFYYSLSFNLALILIFGFIYLRLTVNTNFFDIKDIKSDKKENLLTLAIVLGEKKLINVLILVNILAILPIILGVYWEILPFYSLMLILTIPYTFYYFKKLKIPKINQNFLYNVIVDGEFILWSIFILIGKFLL